MFPTAFFHIFAFDCNIEYRFFVEIVNVTGPNCKLAEDAVRWHLDVHRFALLQTFIHSGFNYS